MIMQFRQHYSSSAGNLYTLDMIGERVLIDPGVSLEKIRQCGIAMAGATVWRSHEHQDHCAAYRHLVDRMALPESSPWQTWGMQHDVECEAAMWVDSMESCLFAIDTGSFDSLPSIAATIFALECNYQDEYLEQDLSLIHI